MNKIPFTAFPFATKLALMLVPFMGWVMFAEFVVDRNGWHRFLPFYRFGQICPYDILVLAILGIVWWRLEQRARQQTQAEAGTRKRPAEAPARCC